MPVSGVATSWLMQAPSMLKGGSSLGGNHFVMLCWTCGALRLSLQEYNEDIVGTPRKNASEAVYEQNSFTNTASRQQPESLQGGNVRTLLITGAGLLRRYLPTNCVKVILGIRGGDAL